MRFSKKKTTSQKARRFKFRQAICTDVGKKRSENQDSYAVVHTALASLFIVADGMGGSRGGRTASTIAVNLVAGEAFDENLCLSQETVRRAVESANEEIFLRSRNEDRLAGMGTTIVALAAVEDRAFFVHVGDSRGYWLHRGELKQITRDHSLVRELLDSGAMSEFNADNHPIAHMLTRSLGPGREVEPEVTNLPRSIEKGDRFLLCCDGLHNLVTDEEIGQILNTNSVAEANSKLLRLALDRGGLDNITIIITEACDLLSADDVVVPGEDEVQRDISADFDFSVNPPKRPPEVPRVESLTAVPKTRISEDKAVERKEEYATSEREADTVFNGIKYRPALFVSLLVILVVSGVLLVLQPKRYAGLPFENQVYSPQVKKFVKKDLNPTTQSSDDLLNWQPGEKTSADIVGANVSVSEPEADKRTIAELAPELADVNLAREAGKPDLNSSSVPQVVSRDEAVDRIISGSLDVSVEENPSVVLELTRSPRNRTPAISDEHAAEIVGGEVVDLFASSEGKNTEIASDVKLELSNKEQKELVETKIKIREEIADIDSRLELLLLENEFQRKDRIAQIEFRSTLINQALEQVQKDKQLLLGEYGKWKDSLQRLNEESTPEILSALAAVDEEAQHQQEEFESVSRNYLQAVENWQGNQRNDKIAAEMAAAGRDFRARRAALFEFVTNRLKVRLEKVGNDFADQDLRSSLLSLRRDRLNRELGFIKGARFYNFSQKKHIYERLTDEREKLVAKLRESQAKLSDHDEMLWRRMLSVQSLQ